MANREKYIEELRQLEQRFLRAAQNGTSEADVNAAAANGGQLVWQATVDGLLPIELPEPDFSQCSYGDRGPAYRITWITAAMVYSDTNPLAFRSERRQSDGATAVWVGKTSKDDWRIRAENFAQLCRDYVDLLSEDRPATPQLVTADDIMVLIDRSTLKNLLVEWRKQGHMQGPGPYDWRVVRPIVVAHVKDHKPDRVEYMPEDYDDLRVWIKRLRDLKSG